VTWIIPRLQVTSVPQNDALITPPSKKSSGSSARDVTQPHITSVINDIYAFPTPH